MGERGDGAHYLECRGGRTGNWFARFHDAIERQVERMMGEMYLGRGTVRTQDYTAGTTTTPNRTSRTSRSLPMMAGGPPSEWRYRRFAPRAVDTCLLRLGTRLGERAVTWSGAGGRTMGRWPQGSGGAPLCWTPGGISALARCGARWHLSRAGTASRKGTTLIAICSPRSLVRVPCGLSRCDISFGQNK